MYKLC